MHLDEEKFIEIINSCKGTGSYSRLVHTIGHVFPNPELVGQSFIKTCLPNSSVVQEKLTKEQLRSMEVDLDKDKDSQETVSEVSQPDNNSQVTVDICAVRRCFEVLNTIELEKFESALVNSLFLLSETLELDLKYGKIIPEINLLNVFVIAFELPWLSTGDFFDKVLPVLCRACALLPLSMQASLVRFWASNCISNLRNMVQTLHQLISFRVLSGQFGSDYAVNDDNIISASVKVSYQLIYYVLSEKKIKKPEFELKNLQSVPLKIF